MAEAETTYNDEDLIAKLKQDFKAADDMSGDWRQEAVELYDLVAGKQWSDIDKKRLEEQLRPALTFNMMAKYIDAVCGIQIANRMDMQFVPREMGDVKLNELLTSAADFFRDECGAYMEESDAWRDMVITGLGATETFLDFDIDPEGMLRVERRDPVELWIDPNSRMQNCVDARYMQRVRYMLTEEVEERWPEKADEVSSMRSMGIEPAQDQYFENFIHHANEAWKYEHSTWGEIQRKLMPVVEYQWFKREKMHRIMTPMGARDVTPKMFSKMKTVFEAQGIPFRDQTFMGKRYYRCFAASNVILQKGESPYQGGFTYAIMSGKRDRNKNSWIGIGRALQEPQKFLNKVLSESLYILSTQAKGGLMAEEDAFVDPKRAENEWASPDSIVWMEPGAIQSGKVMPKPQSPIPGGFDKFLAFAMSSMPETTGLNLEIMGMANKVQPGIVEAQRKESAMSILQWAFDSLKRYYEVHGRILGAYIADYVSDGRLIRITGKEGDKQYVPLLRDKLGQKFDVIVSESPTSANHKQKVFAMMTEILPVLAQNGQGVPPEFFKYSPLPSELSEALMKRLQPSPEQIQAQQEERQIALAKEQAEIGDKQMGAKQKETAAILNIAKAQMMQKEAGMKEAQAVADIQAKRAQAAKDLKEAEAAAVETDYLRKGKALPSAGSKD